MEYEIGETLLWWPHEDCDYPSVVVVVDYSDSLVNGILVTRYLVEYLNEQPPGTYQWLVDGINLSRPKKGSPYVHTRTTGTD